jgi:hypothetical protein
MPRLAIVGSRDFTNLELVKSFVARLKPTTVVVSGGARGVDTVAELAAEQAGLARDTIPADWDLHGKSAGFKRNVQLVNSVDGLVAFWDGHSRGTKHAISLAYQRGIWHRIYREDGSYEQFNEF